jgi:hypothetical protein
MPSTGDGLPSRGRSQWRQLVSRASALDREHHILNNRIHHPKRTHGCCFVRLKSIQDSIKSRRYQASKIASQRRSRVAQAP